MNVTAQQRFDAMYISSMEIQRRLKVNRCSLTFAHQRGTLPQPVVVGGSMHVWERAVVEPFIVRWEAGLNEKRAKRLTTPPAQAALELAE
jgi:hypothetical protein